MKKWKHFKWSKVFAVLAVIALLSGSMYAYLNATELVADKEELVSYNAGVTQLEAGDFPKALEFFSKAFESAPDDSTLKAKAAYNYGYALFSFVGDALERDLKMVKLAINELETSRAMFTEALTIMALRPKLSEADMEFVDDTRENIEKVDMLLLLAYQQEAEDKGMSEEEAAEAAQDKLEQKTQPTVGDGGEDGNNNNPIPDL